MRPIALVASLLILASTNPSVAAGPISCADTEVVGRIMEESYTDPPEVPGVINLGALWTLRVQVEKVIRGQLRDGTITVNIVSDPMIPPTGIEVDFQLKRTAPGHYQWMESERECGN